MKVQRCELCTYYKKIKERYSYSFCTLANKRCLEVKPLECDDLKLTVEVNGMLRKLLKRNNADDYNNDQARAADATKPGQTDPS